VNAQIKEFTGGTRYWGGNEPDLPDEIRPLVERRNALDQEKRQLRNGWFDEHFTTNGQGTGSPAMGASSLFDAPGQKARDKYVADDAATLSMNGNLRAGKKPTARALSIDAMVEQGVIRQDVAVWRGSVLPAELHSELQVGAEFTDMGFQSTATSRSTSEFYADTRLADGAQGDKVMFRYVLREGQVAANVDYGEVVLPRGSRMRIIGRTVGADGVVRIDAEVILNGHR
jgi:hypothetical protein